MPTATFRYKLLVNNSKAYTPNTNARKAIKQAMGVSKLRI